MFKCLDCQKTISAEQLNEKIRCPYCGYRIMIKERPKIPVRVKAK